MRSMKVWSELYKNAAIKEDIIDRMCSEFASTIAQFADRNEPARVIHETMIQFNKRGRVLAQLPNEFIDGWRLGKDWFISMVAQLYLHGAMEGGVNYAERYIRVKELYKVLGWDFMVASNPSWSRVNTVHKVTYNYTDNGVDETRYYEIVLTPSSKYPDGAVYEEPNGKQWEICHLKEDEVYHIIEEHKGEYNNYIEKDVSEREMRKMKRIV